ncbi:EAL domain-containing protein [Cohnella sp. CFH 77786]|uniref:bifunctional diguanylate cyclase/phosphodiesterase n=1 Tax=Cohnella sp. CFH 77786 TaxID=2662265 RepID=UPI001C60F8F7|nr:EAL domain-containing protein [Cohnella sp. CFH 77786]
MLITFAVAFILTGYFVYQNTEKLYIRIIEQQLRTQSDETALRIHSLLTQKETIVDQMSINLDILGFIHSASSRQDALRSPYYHRAMATLNSIASMDSTIGQVWVGSEEGNFYIGSGDYLSNPDYNIKLRPWHAGAVNANPIFFTEPYIDNTTHKLIVSMIKPIKKGDDIKGFVALDLFLTSLPKIMQYELSSGYTFLLSRNGTVLYHPNSNLVMSRYDPEQNGKQELLADRMTKGEKGLVLTSIGGRKEYIGFSPVSATGWSVGVVISYKEAMSQLDAYMRTIMIFYALIVLILVGIIYYLMKYLLKDIPILIRNIRSFSEGDLDVHIKVKSTDEIGQIAAAFQQMMLEIRTNVQKIQRDAYYDVLTQLPNRKLLVEKFNAAIARDNGKLSKVALVLLDLDNFKLINDTQGHSFGDELIKEVGNQFMSICNDRMTAFRFGGDEFIVLIENFADINQLMTDLVAIQGIFSRPLLILGNPVNVTASLGVTVFPNDGQHLEQLLNNADTAMYKAKDRGSNKLMMFSMQMKEEILKRAKIEALLREAINKNQLSLHYQPQFETVSGHIRGFEALLRWSAPELGNISPADFIPIAEDTGLIHPIGDWVMRTAFLQNKYIHERDHLYSVISVNISAVQLKQPDFADRVIRILEETKLAPQYVELEITESYLIESFESSVEILHKLRKFGVNLALDDFGKGYSSLSYLRLLPIDHLKIDKSFVQDMMTDAVAKDMTESIIGLAKRVGLGIIAEGIELEEQLAYLNEFGCDYIQGYLTGKPMPAGQISAFIKEKRV